MPYKFQKAEGVKKCCKQDSNIIKLSSKFATLERLVCKVCSCRHNILHAEPGKLGMTLK